MFSPDGMPGSSEPSSESKRALQFLNTGLIDVVSKAGFALFFFSYTSGLLILNGYLSQYGIRYLGFAQTQYVLAGALWLFLLVFTYCCGHYLVHWVPAIYRKSREERSRWKYASMALSLFFLPNMYFYGLSIITDYKVSMVLPWTWGALFPLVLGTLSASLIADSVREYIRTDSSPEPALRFSGVSTHRAYVHLGHVVLLLSSLSLYSLWTYPKISAVYGGGRPQQIRCVARSEYVGALNSLGLEVTQERRTTRPLELILEMDQEMVLMPPGAPQSKGNIKAVRIRKDYCESTAYLNDSLGANITPK